MINIMQRTRSGGFGQFLFGLIFLVVIGGALWMMMTQAHARRHDKYVQNIPDKCNSNSFQVHMFRALTIVMLFYAL